MKITWAPQTIAIVMLFWAFYPNNPYGYYTLLRWVCCGVFIYLVFQAYKQEKERAVWLFGIFALVYNPIVRFYLNREFWTIINALSIGAAIFSILSNIREYKKKESWDN